MNLLTEMQIMTAELQAARGANAEAVETLYKVLKTVNAHPDQNAVMDIRQSVTTLIRTLQSTPKHK